MMLGLRIGGVAAAAVSAWAALIPGQTIQEDSQLIAQVQVEVAAQRAGRAEEQVEVYLYPVVYPHPEVYLYPVDAEVVDAFRPPAHVGAPGNRGLEYDTEPGQPVGASAAGEVVFAGSVAHNRFVTVLHRDGLRTAYGYLGWIAVEEGDWVAPGQLLGTTSERFFFSVRAGDGYLDPALVLTAGRVRLIPHREPDGRSRLPAYGQGT